MLLNQRANALLVDVVRERPKQGYRHRLHAGLPEETQRPYHGFFIEWKHNLTCGPDAFWHAIGQRPWDVGIREDVCGAEWVRPAALAEQEDIAVSFRHKQRSFSGPAGENRINSVSRSVNEQLGLAKDVHSARNPLLGGVGHDIENALDRIGRNGKRLVNFKGAASILDNQVRERAAGVHS